MNQYSKEFFQDELLRFYNEMTKKSFWESDKIDLALKAISHVYFNCVDFPGITTTFQAAINEFSYRRQMMF